MRNGTNGAVGGIRRDRVRGIAVGALGDARRMQTAELPEGAGTEKCDPSAPAIIAIRNRGRRGFQPRYGNKKAARCRFYRLQSAPLPASVQCEWTQRALKRGHYLIEVQRHEEQVKAAPAACWLPSKRSAATGRIVFTTQLCPCLTPPAKTRGRAAGGCANRGRLHLRGIPAHHAVLRAPRGDPRASSGPRIA